MGNAYSVQPDIMAIGDSMYQGVRSLSLNADLVLHSPPAQVAEAGGWQMVLPNPAAELVFDLETLTRQEGLLGVVGGLQAHARASLAHWPVTGREWSEHEAFDNVAFGGAAIASLWEETYQARISEVQTFSARLLGPALGTNDLLSTVGSLWYALGICFTLNPRHRDEQMHRSAIEQVQDRAPSILLINIGSNEGLFRAGLAGDVSQASFDHLGRIPGLVTLLAQRLKELPARVEKIVYNSVLRPRFVPNLMPPPDDRSHPGEDYFVRYGNRIGSTQQSIDGAALRRLDDAVKVINAESRAILERIVGARLLWNDVFSLADQFDGKHWLDRGLTVRLPRGTRVLRNEPIEPNIFGLESGFAGLDNMHPSVPGYAVIADTVLAALGRNERIDKDRAYARDTLLTNLPGGLLLDQAELALLPLSGILGGS